MIWLVDTGYQKFSSILKGLDMTRHLQYIYQMSMTSTFNIVGMVQSPISPCKTRQKSFPLLHCQAACVFYQHVPKDLFTQ